MKLGLHKTVLLLAGLLAAVLALAQSDSSSGATARPGSGADH